MRRGLVLIVGIVVLLGVGLAVWFVRGAKPSTAPAAPPPAAQPERPASVLVGEPITVNLILGLVAAFAGIWVATTEPRRSARAMT